MLIKAKRQLPPSTDYRRYDFEIVDVEVPDAHVLCTSNDVRVVATFDTFTDGEQDYPDLDGLSPAVVVERCYGVDALGQKRWQRCSGERWQRCSGDGDVISWTAAIVIGALAEMLKARLYTLTPADYVVVEAPLAAAADTPGLV